MLDAVKQLLANQFEAVLCTLDLCVDRCPDRAWDAPVGNNPFCQVVFHALFFADYYLGPNADVFRRQPFHLAHGDFFGDYEQLEDREPVSLYERGAVKEYLQQCRDKASEVIAAETAETLCGPSGFERRAFSRAELHVYNIRHIQHHAAQLSLRLRIDFGEDIPWVGSGCQDVSTAAS